MLRNKIEGNKRTGVGNWHRLFPMGIIFMVEET